MIDSRPYSHLSDDTLLAAFWTENNGFDQDYIRAELVYRGLIDAYLKLLDM